MEARIRGKSLSLSLPSNSQTPSINSPHTHTQNKHPEKKPYRTKTHMFNQSVNWWLTTVTVVGGLVSLLLRFPYEKDINLENV